MHPWIAEADAEALPDLVEEVMTALGECAISHRCAGGLFAAIQNRRNQLDRQARDAGFGRLRDTIMQLGLMAAPPPAAGGLFKVPSFELNKPTGPQSENANR